VTPLAALQDTLAAEHAAVYVYALVGGRLSTSAYPAASRLVGEAYEVHLRRRDDLRADIAAAGHTPVPPAPAYRVGVRSRAAGPLLAVARTTEERCAEVYAQLVAASTGGRRRWAVDALTDAAVRVLSFGGSPDAYPGLPEL
jgi:Domain of unknown function (DUF4439)